MLHIIAFVVIGLVVGYLVASSGKKAPAVPVVLGLIGGLVGGYLLRDHRYLSLGTAVIGALILGYVGSLASGKARR